MKELFLLKCVNYVKNNNSYIGLIEKSIGTLRFH